jgi:rhodanese-related sulfurtransferase
LRKISNDVVHPEQLGADSRRLPFRRHAAVAADPEADVADEGKEFTGGRLPNAIHIPLSQLDGRVSELAKMTKRPVVAYCSRGQRSRMAGGALAKAGFTDLYHLHGGIKAWKDASLPLEK